VPWALLLVQAGLITGCAAGGDQKSADADAPARRGSAACFYASNVSNWTVLDRSALIVYAPNKSHAFRVQVSPGASDLRWADSLAFVSRSNRICGRAGDQIVMPTGTTKRSYSVIDVRRLDQASLEGLLATYGKAGRSAEVEPGESPGAAIERDLDTAESEDEPAVPGDEEQTEN
jgi:hypothetical protein